MFINKLTKIEVKLILNQCTKNTTLQKKREKSQTMEELVADKKVAIRKRITKDDLL